MAVNPVVLEIIRGSLSSTIKEMELLMERCAMSPFIKANAWKVAKADQASKTKTAEAAAIWTREPIVKRRRLLPSCRKISRALNRLRNLPDAPAFAFGVKSVILFPGRPERGRHGHTKATA